mmetsp:Transcript_22789/g.25370  ORF Transcript_22789/g.25370 Transcript_22789/m.25370 type:complete len:352 (-) Transcript_22789:108-1163(-)
MGTCSTSQSKTTRDINRQLSKDKRKLEDEVRLLLLGPGESGKSTVMKQMKIIQNSGKFPEIERKRYRNAIYANCITQMKTLVSAAIKLNVAFEAKHEDIARTIHQLPAAGDSWSPEIAQMIKLLWKDAGIKRVFDMRNGYYQLNDSAAYFFDDIERFIPADYIPSVDDVLRARVRTTGIEEAQFQIEDFKFRMVDVGGQRCERRKWIHCFEGSVVTAVIFCVGLSEYDQNLREEGSVNRMDESLTLFTELCNSSWFCKTPFVIFLNKVDLFKEKIKVVDLNVCFPSYTGGCDFDKASVFIKSRFIERNHSPHPIYSHFTCALSTENIKYIFKVVKETVINGILHSLGMHLS